MKKIESVKISRSGYYFSYLIFSIYGDGWPLVGLHFSNAQTFSLTAYSLRLHCGCLVYGFAKLFDSTVIRTLISTEFHQLLFANNSMKQIKICYSRNFLLSRCMVSKQLAVGLQTSRHCWTPIHKAPLDYSTWVTLKSLGLLQRLRGCRRGESLMKKIKTHPIKSYISDRNSDQLNIQNSLLSTWSTSTTTKDTKRSLIYIQPTQSTKSTTVGSSLELWNARSLNGKSAILSDCILSIDIMVLTETWFKGNDRDVTTIAKINNILPDHQLIHRPRCGAEKRVQSYAKHLAITVSIV